MALHVHDIMPQFLWDLVIAYLPLAMTDKLFADVPKARRHFTITTSKNPNVAPLQLKRVSDFAISVTIPNYAVTTLQPLKVRYDSSAPIGKRYSQTRLVKLVASFNIIKTVDHLYRLTRLQHLEVSHCKLSNLKMLFKLHSLTYLDASDNKIKDVGFLVNMTKLKHLNLASNCLTSADGFSDLAYLEYLNINSNCIKKLELHCVALTTLLTQSRSLEWISVATGCPRLQTLQVDWNNEYILRLISSCQLTTLVLVDGKQQDLSELAKMTTLTSLDLRCNRIKDITSLSNLTSLVSLELSYNYDIHDLSPLAHLTQLQILRLNNNALRNTSNIQSLLSMTCLTHLDLNGNDMFRDHRFASVLQQIQHNNPNLVKLLPFVSTAQGMSKVVAVIEIIIDLACSFESIVTARLQNHIFSYSKYHLNPMSFTAWIIADEIKALVLAKINACDDEDLKTSLLYKLDNVDSCKAWFSNQTKIAESKWALVSVLDGHFGYRVVKYDD
ncbi:Hypothetical protein MVR_LOCUS359 [uncultured virus]|nr:Hypothetical protein MVR_LOCUS359 [uncultured virus]